MKVKEFLDIVCDGLNRDPGTLSIEDTSDTVEEWDSVGHLAIIGTIDSALDIDVTTDELQTFTSLRELVDTLKAMGALED